MIEIVNETGTRTRLDRPGGTKVLSIDESRQIHAILVAQLSRSGSFARGLLKTVRQLEDWKDSVIAMSGVAFDDSSPYRRILARILSCIAGFEVAKERGKKLTRQAGVLPKSNRLWPKEVA
ncbi:recombinase family protein, partial [Serratia marcescens]|uniref:recombinase family protein n=1 Tax=Serratia marcescens TaxID=615 RepID=UPI0027DBE06D